MARPRSDDGTTNKDLGLFKPHLLDLASNLNRLRSEDSLTDITVKIGNRHFRAHRNVLAASSSYFQAMFTSGFQESTSSEVLIEEGISDILEKLLDFVYTGMVDFNLENIVDILTMASYLQMKTAVDACTQFLRQKMLDAEDANVAWGNGIIFQVYLMAKHHELAELKELCWQVIIDDFVPLSRTDGFKKFVPVELLSNLLERSDLTKPVHQKIPWHLRMSEMLGIIPAESIATLIAQSGTVKYEEGQILEAVVSWLEHDWPARKTHATTVLEKVRLGVIPQDALKKHLDKDQYKEIPEMKKILSVVIVPEGAAACPGIMGDPRMSNMFCTRGTITVLLATGGSKLDEEGPFARYFYFSDPDTCDISWTPLPKFPMPQRRVIDKVRSPVYTPHPFTKMADIHNMQDHTMADLDGKLYLAGGVRTDGDKAMQDQFYEYDAKANTWGAHTYINNGCGRSGYALVKKDEYIYVIGGWDWQGFADDDPELATYRHMYDARNKFWERDVNYLSEYTGVCDPSTVVYKDKILVYGHRINDGLPSESVSRKEWDKSESSVDKQRKVRTSLHTLQMYDTLKNNCDEIFRQRHDVHTAHGHNAQYSALVVRKDRVYRVVYEKRQENQRWVSFPRVNELLLDIENEKASYEFECEFPYNNYSRDVKFSWAPSGNPENPNDQQWVRELHVDGEKKWRPTAKLGKEEDQRWLPEYHVPGAFCIEGEIYVNVNGCIVNTGQQMPREKPTAKDKVNFSRWLGVDSPEIANAAVTLFSFDQYKLSL